MTTSRPAAVTLTLTLAFGLGGCFAAPETCTTCAANANADAADGSRGAGTGGRGTGGNVAGAGGSAGAAAGAGGATGTGGAPGTGGATGSGGDVAAGGSTGSGGAGTGGSGSGGAGTGGAGTGTGGRGTGGVGTGGVGTGGAIVIDPDSVLWYKLDESSGTTAADSAMAGGVARNATLSATRATFTTNTRSMAAGTHALDLMPTGAGGGGGVSGGFATLPAVPTLATAAATYSVWVYLRADQSWQRVFDFGSSSTTTYMFLTTHAAGGGTTNNVVRFAITTVGNGSEQQISGTSLLSLNAWHHVAVVLGGAATYTGTLYVDGASVGANAAMTLHPSDLGTSTNNWLGRSQFAADPYLNGAIDDFRVYKRALTVAEITALAGAPP